MKMGLGIRTVVASACGVGLAAVGCTSILGDFSTASLESKDAGGEVDASQKAPPSMAGPDGGAAVDAPNDSPATVDAQRPDFLLTAAAGAAQSRVVRGQTAAIALDVASMGGFSGDVTVSVTGLSGGVTVDPLTISAGAATGTVTIRATAVATLGGDSITISGTSGSLTHTLPLTLVVQDTPGSVDTTFGTSGRIVLPLGIGGTDVGNGGLALESDGVIVCGNSQTAQGTIAVALARLTLQGALDPSFGTAGVTLANRPSGTVDVCGAVNVLPSGALAVGGFTYFSSQTGAHAFLAARFTAAGAVDPTFGSGTGFVATPFTTTDAKAIGMATQSNGKLVLGGFGGGGIAFARYGTDGSLDSTFGPDATGQLVTTFPNTGSATAVALQSSGDVVASIQFSTFLLFRYTPLGILDTSFGTAGHVALDVGGQGSSTANCDVLGPDGAIVVAGSAEVSGGLQGMAVARFASTGDVDMSFGTAGSVVVTYAGGAAVAHAAALGGDGSIALAGESFVNGSSAFTVARLTGDGKVDPAFGTGGRSTFEVGGSAEAIAVDSIGRILVAGHITDSGRMSAVVYRLWP